MRVLVVDDGGYTDYGDPKESRRIDGNIMLQNAIAQLGDQHDVVVTDDYRRAAELIQNENFGAVLLDLFMNANLDTLEHLKIETGEEVRYKAFMDLPSVGILPVGEFLAMLAVKRQVPYVGVLSNANSHGEKSLLLDIFMPMMTELGHGDVFRMGKSVCCFTGDERFNGISHLNDPGTVIKFEQIAHMKSISEAWRTAWVQEDESGSISSGAIAGKRWGNFLNHIIKNAPAEPGLDRRSDFE